MKPGPKPKGMVSTVWSEELAYSVGLLTADGSLSKDRRHINFTSGDKDLIQTFQECLHIEHISIGKKSSSAKKGAPYFQVQFGDVLFYQWLQK
jgi:hypothetical protein